VIPLQIPSQDDETEKPYPIVYLQDEEAFGIIIFYGAFFSKVRYWKDGIAFEVFVENDDILDGD
jgi:predicted alpha/beta superfamily hydrolase